LNDVLNELLKSSGVTVGIVAVPQGMGYAKIANLSPVSFFYLLHVKHIPNKNN
jgi:MFS superfamily sulfate permease-like transporter